MAYNRVVTKLPLLLPSTYGQPPQIGTQSSTATLIGNEHRVTHTLIIYLLSTVQYPQHQCISAYT